MTLQLYGPLFCLLAYLFGSIPSGVVLSKILGTRDPRQAGSGNIGFTNVLRISGKKIAIFTLAGDLGKGWLTGEIAKTFFYDSFWGLCAMLLVVIGHIFPVFLKFRGGKGVATGLGGVIGFDFQLGIILLIVWLTAFGLCKYSSVGALTAFTVFPLICWLMQKNLYFFAFSIVLSPIIIFKHRGNIKRLIEGTESKV